jgi:Rps23 Pro-64 3,4-dihydroxylase Tpa1-like proline 4-hydroxylase
MINPNLFLSANEIKDVYYNQHPFPHIILDNFFDETLINTASDEAKDLFTNINQNEHRFTPSDSHDQQIFKRFIRETDKMTPIIKLISQYVNSEAFLEWLRAVTDMPGLVGDDYYFGGGLHVTGRGGKLGIHHDFNFLGDANNPSLYRKVNMLVYLNKDWDDSWGGNLELWEKDLSSMVHEIKPLFNRVVLFNIEDAPHGHPHPLNCPNNESRRSLAYYFYDKTPVNNKLYHRAFWKHGKELK